MTSFSTRFLERCSRTLVPSSIGVYISYFEKICVMCVSIWNKVHAASIRGHTMLGLERRRKMLACPNLGGLRLEYWDLAMSWLYKIVIQRESGVANVVKWMAICFIHLTKREIEQSRKERHCTWFHAKRVFTLYAHTNYVCSFKKYIHIYCVCNVEWRSSGWSAVCGFVDWAHKAVSVNAHFSIDLLFTWETKHEIKSVVPLRRARNSVSHYKYVVERGRLLKSVNTVYG